MKFVIKHEIKGRIRIHVIQKQMTFKEADTLHFYLSSQKFITFVKVRERVQDVTICYVGNREDIIYILRTFKYENIEVPDAFLQNSGRKLNREYWDKLVTKVVLRAGSQLFLPRGLRNSVTAIKSVKYIWIGLKHLSKKKIEVPVLDATAVGVPILRGDFDTASSVMFLLGVGELLEEWTHKKSVGDLARSMSLNVSKVWLFADGQEILVPATNVKVNDQIVIHMGNVIPFDGTVISGNAMVNQASLTGEPLPVHKCADVSVYAGTVVEEGELTKR